MTGDARPGTMMWARRVFAEELARLQVCLDERRALDVRLDGLAGQIGVSRSQLVRSYLDDDHVKGLAQHAAEEATGRDVSLLEADRTVARECPESSAWPEAIRNYLVDHEATAALAGAYVEAMVGPQLGVCEEGLLRLRYEDHHGLQKVLGYEAEGTIPIVTFQHRHRVGGDGVIRADGEWGRPTFEWAYELVEHTYRLRTGIDAGRLLWAWADLPTVLVGHRPDVAKPEAAAELWKIAERGAVMVVARVPLARCLVTSHVLWDGLLLRAGTCRLTSMTFAGFIVGSAGARSPEPATRPMSRQPSRHRGPSGSFSLRSVGATHGCRFA